MRQNRGGWRPPRKCNVRDETPFRKRTHEGSVKGRGHLPERRSALNSARRDHGRLAPAVVARVRNGVAVVLLSAVAAAIVPVISRRAACRRRWIAGAVDRSGG